jgi:hypothetical protein
MFPVSEVPCIYVFILLLLLDDALCLCIYDMLAVPYSSVSLGGGDEIVQRASYYCIPAIYFPYTVP